MMPDRRLPDDALECIRRCVREHKVLKDLPVAQCDGCSEYLIADAVFGKVEELLSKVDTSVELEIIPFAA